MTFNILIDRQTARRTAAAFSATNTQPAALIVIAIHVGSQFGAGHQ
jgi:hypothetical protein